MALEIFKLHALWRHKICLLLKMCAGKLAYRQARFSTISLGKFKERVVEDFSNKRERAKEPFDFSLTFKASCQPDFVEEDLFD